MPLFEDSKVKDQVFNINRRKPKAVGRLNALKNRAEMEDKKDKKALESLIKPKDAHGKEIASMGYRKRTPAPTTDGGRMRANDIKTGSRKVGKLY